MIPPDLNDDITIFDHELLWRRVYSTQVETNPITQNSRPVSGAFRTPDHPLSVDICSLTSPEVVLADLSGMILAEFSVGVARNAGCKVVRDPIEGQNPAHALVYGDHKNGGLTKSQARRIANEAILRGF